MTATAAELSIPLALVQRTDAAGVATLTLNRPDCYNTLSSETISALSASLVDIAASTHVRVVVIVSSLLKTVPALLR